jgi:Type II secretion system (T2SS), protein G
LQLTLQLTPAMNDILLLALAPCSVLAPQASQASAEARAGTNAQHEVREVAFLEIPDLQKLLAAYSRAPFVQMVNDQVVRESAGGILESAGIEIGPPLAAALERLGLPAEVATAPLQALSGMASQVRSASLSLSLNGEPAALSDALGKSFAALKQLEELQAKVAAHAEKNQGYPPDTLDDLDLPPELKRDPWGHPFELDVDLTSLEARVVSLGSDGAAGGEGFAADLSLANAEELPDQLLPRALGVVVEVGFTAPAAREFAQARALDLAAKIGWQANATQDVMLRGERARVRELRDPKQPERAVWLLEQGNNLLLGYGSGSLEHVLASGREVRRSTEATPELTELARFLEEPSGATVAQGWMHLDPLEQLLEGIERELETQPGSEFGHLPFGGDGLFRLRLDGERFVTELVTQSAPADPSAAKELDFLACVGGGPVPDSMWDFVPAESIGVYATSIDGQKLYGKILEALDAAGPDKHKALAELEKKHGFSLEQDLIGNLGGGAAAYLLPISGLTIPGAALVVELRDAERFRTGLDGVLRLLEEQAAGEFTVRYKPYHDQPMWSFSFGGNQGMGAPFSVSPSIAIVKDHLLITLTALRAKKEIKRLMEEPAERHPMLKEGATPADATAMGYMDWPSLFDGTYEGARKAIALFGGNALPFDPELLPAADTFTRFFKPTRMWSHRPADGVRATRIESSFGPETWLGLIGGGGALSVGVQARHATSPAVAEAEAEVTEEDPERAEAVSQSSELLSEVATRLEVFRIDKGHYPAKLGELLEPTPNYPRGYLGRDDVPVDGWGRAFVYFAASDGASYGLWSLGENGADERGSGDDVRVP